MIKAEADREAADKETQAKKMLTAMVSVMSVTIAQTRMVMDMAIQVSVVQDALYLLVMWKIAQIVMIAMVQ